MSPAPATSFGPSATISFTQRQRVPDPSPPPVHGGSVVRPVSRLECALYNSDSLTHGNAPTHCHCHCSLTTNNCSLTSILCTDHSLHQQTMVCLVWVSTRQSDHVNERQRTTLCNRSSLPVCLSVCETLQQQCTSLNQIFSVDRHGRRTRCSVCEHSNPRQAPHWGYVRSCRFS